MFEWAVDQQRQPLFEKVLVNFLDLKGVLNSASDVVRGKDGSLVAVEASKEIPYRTGANVVAVA